MSSFKAFAPVNIAWIKYMGKENDRPTNSSLSLTLHSFGTTTSMAVLFGKTDELSFTWDPLSYVPPEAGRKKAEAFLRRDSMWKNLLEHFGFEMHWPKSMVKISTSNNVPAGTGIATSASAFAALTMAWSAVLAGPRQEEWMEKFNSGYPVFRKFLAAAAGVGSGSACRSLDGPWMEWSPIDGVSKIDGGEIEWVDLLLVVESSPKLVSSSEAHVKVKTSPLFAGRTARAESRLEKLKILLRSPESYIPSIRKLVLEEALDMHELFHTSTPPFRYMQPLSEEIISLFREPSHDRDEKLPSNNGVITLDAGANVHLFVPVSERNIWHSFLAARFPRLKILADEVGGKGPHYEVVS